MKTDYWIRIHVDKTSSYKPWPKSQTQSYIFFGGISTCWFGWLLVSNGGNSDPWLPVLPCQPGSGTTPCNQLFQHTEMESMEVGAGIWWNQFKVGWLVYFNPTKWWAFFFHFTQLFDQAHFKGQEQSMETMGQIWVNNLAICVVDLKMMALTPQGSCEMQLHDHHSVTSIPTVLCEVHDGSDADVCLEAELKNPKMFRILAYSWYNKNETWNRLATGE